MSDQKADESQREKAPAQPGRAAAVERDAGPQPPARAVARLIAPEAGAPQRAQASADLQQAVGNARVNEMLGEEAVAPEGGAVVQRQPAAQGQAPTTGMPPAKSAGTTPAYATENLRRKLAATVLAESAPGQVADIRWVYYNRVAAAQGEAGLSGSAAYTGKGVWYKIWLSMLGDQAYARHALPKKPQFEGFATVQDFCEKNGFMQTTGAARAAEALRLVDEMFSGSERNPYQGWIGQGNLDDFNNVSKPKSRYWRQARAYYWLQQRGEVKAIYVKVLPAGKSTQFIFDAASIERYFATRPLPETVPPYKVTE